MKHQLSMKAAAAYGHLIDSFVPVYMRDDFKKRFEEFLDAYDADIKAEKLAAEKLNQQVKDALKNVTFKFEDPRAIPKVGEIYRDTLNYRLKILAVLNDANGYIILMQNCSDFLKSSIRLMTLTDFEKLTVYKED